MCILILIKWVHTKLDILLMSVSTLAMMSMEQAFLAASCSVMLSRTMTHSIRPPLHMTLEVQVSRELRTSSHTRASSDRETWKGSAHIPEPLESREEPDLETDSREDHSSCCGSIIDRTDSQLQIASCFITCCSKGTRPLHQLSDFTLFFFLSGFDFSSLPISQPSSSCFLLYP